MPGLPTIYVDFSVRDSEGRFYYASMSRFDNAPALGDHFLGTDHESFDGIECIVLALDSIKRAVYHRPINPADVPGTYADPASITDAPKSDPVAQLELATV